MRDVSHPMSRKAGRGMSQGKWAPAAEAASPLLLDTYPADAAYSLRKLRTDYAGSAVRIRRSSDDAEQDIGFSGNNFDSASAASFCGAGDGFVVTWYDQSGNGYDLSQTTAANQPQIISSGAGFSSNGKSAISLASATFFLTATSQPQPSAATLFMTMEIGTKTFVVPFAGAPTSTYLSAAQSGSASTTLNGNAGSPSYTINGSAFGGTTRDDLFVAQDVGQIVLAVTNVNMSTAAWTERSLPYRSNPSGAQGPQYVQEAVVFHSDVSSDRAAIESAINDYYGAY